MKTGSDGGKIIITQGKTSTKKSLSAEEKSEKDDLRKGKEDKILPASLIPGHKEFNKKRTEDIENKENNYIRTRTDEKIGGSFTLKKSLKLVKRIFKK